MPSTSWPDAVIAIVLIVSVAAVSITWLLTRGPDDL